MNTHTRILLKLTGEIFLAPNARSLDANLLRHIAHQIKELIGSHVFGIVIGGGNFFRGHKQGTELGMTPAAGHQVGMLATMMNGLIIKDIFEQEGIPSSLFCAIPCSEVGSPISPQGITDALRKQHVLIFTGGTGNPFFTTDTTAVLRGLQMGAAQIWKGTTVDGIYDADPKVQRNARRISSLTYQEALAQKLGIMDGTAFALAQHHNMPIRVFNIFAQNSLITAAHTSSFGSTLCAP